MEEFAIYLWRRLRLCPIDRPESTGDVYNVKRRDSRFPPVLHAICNYRATRSGHDTWPNASLCEFKQVVPAVIRLMKRRKVQELWTFKNCCLFYWSSSLSCTAMVTIYLGFFRIVSSMVHERFSFHLGYMRNYQSVRSKLFLTVCR